MAHVIEASFVRQFEREVHEAYQRQGSLLRNTVRVKNGIVGASTTWQRIGSGVATQKTRHGIVNPMNIDHVPIECILGDWYAGDWIDKLDELKIAHDERAAVVNAGAYALGRRTDDMIITALNAAETGTPVNLTALTLDVLTNWVAALGARDVNMQLGMVFGLVSWPVWARLMSLPQFASSDFVGADMPFKTAFGQPKEWAGAIWMPHTGLTGGAGARECHVYHKTAVGHAVGADVTTDITWHGDRAAWFVNNMMSQGATMIDADGVIRMRCREA